MESGGLSFRPGVIVLFALCAVCGDTLREATVGFEIFHRSKKVGTLQKRVEWFIRWTREVDATEF